MLNHMRHRVLPPLLMIASLPLLAACTAQTADTVAHVTTASPAPTAVDIRPWTAVISQQKAAVTESQQKLDDDTCSAGSAGALPCSPLYVARYFEMEAVSTELQNAVTSSATTFIGPAPSEIAARYADTVEAANAAAAAGRKWEAHCTYSLSIKCHGKAFSFDEAVRNLQSQLDGWQPYL